MPIKARRKKLLKIQRNNTLRLYYGKWPYKVEINLRGAAMIKRWPLSKVIEWCGHDEHSRRTYNYGMYRDVDPHQILKFVTAVGPIFDQYEHKLRTEYYSLNVYLDSEAAVTALEQAIPWCISSIYAPANQEELDLLLNNKRKIICDMLPHNGYKYKVTLKERTPMQTKLQFKTWCSNYNAEDVKFTPSTAKWLDHNKNYLQSPFFYLKDDKLLTMCRLFLGTNVRTVEEYIPRHTLISE